MGGCFVLVVLLFSILGTAGAFPTLYRARNFTQTVPGSYYGADVEYAFPPTGERSHANSRLALVLSGLQVSAGVHWCVFRVLSRALPSLLFSLYSLLSTLYSLLSTLYSLLSLSLTRHLYSRFLPSRYTQPGAPGFAQCRTIQRCLGAVDGVVGICASTDTRSLARSSRALTLLLALRARSPGRTSRHTRR